MKRLFIMNTIYNEDCRKTMERISDNSISLIITSPPYSLLKEYEKNIPYSWYCRMMSECFTSFNRILIPGGYAVVNFGDYFNSGNRFYPASVPACYPAALNYFHWGVKEAGLDLQATRIWRKMFSKMGIPFVCNSHPRNIFDYEHVWTFRKKDITGREVVNDRKLSQRGVIGEDWTSNAGLAKHCAAFPIELPLWALKVYMQKGGVVYDPFMGSGTTALACKRMSYDWLGSELSSEYVVLAKERLNGDE